MPPRRAGAPCAASRGARETVGDAGAGSSSGGDADDDANDAVPALVVFDLDACLWSPEMFQLCVRGRGAAHAALARAAVQHFTLRSLQAHAQARCC
jgi:hypothetical protein